MMTKEELLQKGIPEETADEIISAFSTTEEENSLQALQKALTDEPEMDDLVKAGGKDDSKDSKEDEGEDKEYDEKYMKKYMKRYMKENKDSSSKMADDVGVSGGKMEKAISDVDLDSEAGVVEMTDLAPFLKDQSEFNSEMVKAVLSLAESIDLISAKTEKNYDLMEKSAKVQVETAKGLGEFFSTPQGRKGIKVNVDLEKAQSEATNNSIGVYNVLMKAVQNGDETAGLIVSDFESKGKNVSALNDKQKNYISTLMGDK